jgi:putative oxygen-independent coproporphyrinogen III oxidase
MSESWMTMATSAPQEIPETATDRMTRYMRAGILNFSALPPLTLYVHWPFCLKKCPYCDFNSHERAASMDAALEQRYLQALRLDLEGALPWIWGRKIHSVFMGGGTPSLFSPQAIDSFLTDVRALLSLEAGCEITLEANPGTFERERFKAYRSAGVTRLSLGIQSFDDIKLKALGRVHDAQQAHAAVAEAAAAFDTFNIDLMYALPDQSLSNLQQDLSHALAYQPPHLSVYHLTLEPNTYFAKYPPQGLPEDDLAADMLDLILEQSEAHGLERYEVSAFARPGHRCVHNLNYWQFGDYLGIGAGAHSKLSFPHRVIRQVRFKDPERYMQQAIQGHAITQDTEVARSELPFEFMLNALRLKEGFLLQDFIDRTGGLPLSSIEAALIKAEQRKLLDRDWEKARPTAQGFDFLNDLQQLFLSAS